MQMLYYMFFLAIWIHLKKNLSGTYCYTCSFRLPDAKIVHKIISLWYFLIIS